MAAPRSALTVGLVLTLLLAGGLAGTSAAQGDAFATGIQIEADAVVLRATLDDDGSAVWMIRHRIALDDENATQAFETLREDIRRNRSEFEARFEERMQSTVAIAENATDREMGISNVSVSTGTTATGDGLVEYSFEWSGFAAVDGSRLRAGDAISGLFLDAEQTLQFEWPSQYGVVSTTPQPDDLRQGVAVWNGRRAFASEEPRIVLSSQATPVQNENPEQPGTSGPSERGLSPLVLLGGLAILAVLVAGSLLAVQRRGDGFPGIGSGSADDGAATAANGEGTSTTAADSGGDESSPPEELLSNEERVLRLLEENGGRMKQQDVVSELDWTDAKTSQVVGSLREADEIEVFRIGRENVLALPGESDLG